MKKIMSMEAPTAEKVKRCISTFDGIKGAYLSLQVIDNIVEQYPENNDPAQVLSKVVLFNRLYSTNVYGVVDMAEHIKGLDMDHEIDAGDDGVVEKIALITIGGKERRFYSFATKYCSMHRPLLYPLYDSYVEICLMEFRQQFQFAMFRREDLRTYSKFRAVIDSFMEVFNLGGFNYREMDKYLWVRGRELAGNPL